MKVPFLAAALLLAPSTPLPAADPITQEAPALEACFTAQKVVGTFVLHDLTTNTLWVCSAARAAQRFIPASTFKIANTVIGLEVGAVKNVDEILPYGGKPQPIKAWEHDMPLREAIQLSAVPIYQELARRIGLERMASHVKAFHYGNGEIGTVVDQFWLEGTLKISALEQVEFLARLVQGKLPARPESIAAVKEITLRETSDGRELHYKTGWGQPPGEPQIGWLVGWVQSKEGTSTFALNIDLAKSEDAPKRLIVAKECLKMLGTLK
jgi:beta-lactamase class D